MIGVDSINITNNSIKEAMNDIPTMLNNLSQRTLKDYGEQQIKAITVLKTPLEKYIETAINAMSLGKFDQLKQKHNIKTLYHTGLLIALYNGVNIICEKNEVVDIYPFRQFKKGTIQGAVPFDKKLTLSQLIDNGIKYMGESKFFSYSALENNCQAFCIGVLSGSGLMNLLIGNFILQDMKPMRDDLNNSMFSYVPTAMNTITNTASRVSRLIGKGVILGGKRSKDKEIKQMQMIKKLKLPMKFIKIILNSQFKTL